MKKLWLVLIVGIFMMGVVSATMPISSCQELQDINNNLTEDYYLTENIDCFGFGNFEPIGNASNQFEGSLDGKEYKINDLTIRGEVGNSTGLFSHTAHGSEIRNIKLENVDIKGYKEVGSLVGYNLGNVRNSYARGSMVTYGLPDSQSSGGLIGVNAGLIKNSYVDMQIHFGGGSYMGGLVGTNLDGGNISYSYSKGTITISQESESDWSDYYGGLVGYSYGGIIERSYSDMDLSGRGSYVGGLVGRCLADPGSPGTCIINESYATGDILKDILNGDILAIAGGFLGMHDGDVYNSYSRGKVDISNRAGGFCGYLSHGYLSATYSTGDVDSGSIPRGGFSAYSYAMAGLSSYWDVQTSGQSSSGFGIGRTTLEMKNPDTFTDDSWDFTNIWQINPAVNDGYPSLKWQTEGCISDGCNGDCPRGCGPAEDIDCDMTTTCCGDGICNGNEVPGPDDVAPNCNSDCGDKIILSDIRWENMDGNPITTSALGKMVRMVQTNTDSGDFEIFEDGGESGDDSILTGLNNISGVNEGSNLEGVWRITQDDFNKGEPDSGVEMADEHIEAYFKVNSEESYNLNISDVRDDDQMVVTLDSPNCGENFTIRDLTDIVINASDPDDNITGNVSIDGEVTHFSNGVITIPHTWINAGNIQVELYAENSKGHRIRKITSVMVIDDDSNVPRDYVAACIDNPADFSDITSSKVFFNASSSRGLKCDAHVSTPDDCETMGVKDLYFSWRFSDGLINFNHEGTNILSYMFYKNFATAGHNWAVLDVEFM